MITEYVHHADMVVVHYVQLCSSLTAAMPYCNGEDFLSISLELVYIHINDAVLQILYMQCKIAVSEVLFNKFIVDLFYVSVVQFPAMKRNSRRG